MTAQVAYDIKIPLRNGKEFHVRAMREDPHGFYRVLPSHPSQKIPEILSGQFTSLDQITRIVAGYASKLPTEEDVKVVVEQPTVKKRFKKRDKE